MVEPKIRATGSPVGVIPGMSTPGTEKGNARAPEAARKICWTDPQRPWYS